MRLRSVAAAIATLALSATGLVACGDGGGATLDGAGDPNIVRTAASEPQNGLIPTNTNESNGSQVLELLYRGLVSYDENGKSHNQVADSITANPDSTEFTVRLKDGWTFTDGTPVTADSFIDAWNYGAAGKTPKNNKTSSQILKGLTTSKTPAVASKSCPGCKK